MLHGVVLVICLAQYLKESNINFVKVDVDKENDIARGYGVMTIPTVILFKNGEEVKRNIGYMSKE